MSRKLVSGIFLLLLFTCILAVAFDIRVIETESAETKSMKYQRDKALDVRQMGGTVEDYIWMASFGSDNLANNGLPGRYVGTDNPYNGFGVPNWTGNFSLTESFASVSSITVHALPFTGGEYTYTLTEGVDYLVHTEEDLIELITSVDVPVINEHWVDGVNNSLNGWPWIKYVSSGISSVYVDLHNGTARFSPNAGYTGDYTQGEWWFDPDLTWELEGWWALGYFCPAPYCWPAGSEWWINYTSTSYITVDYATTEPEPYIAHPLNCSLIWGETIDNKTIEIGAVELNPATNIISTTFEYRQGELGSWEFIAVDSNSTDGWEAPWNLTDLSEGNYYIRVTMENNISQIGEDTAHVYYDPTPPMPTLEMTGFPAIVDGIVDLAALTLDENVISTEFSIYYNYTFPCDWLNKNIPKIDSEDVAQPGHCGPTAAAACLAYWDDLEYPPDSGLHPFAGLYNEGDEDGLADMARRIAELSNVNAQGGVTDRALTNGITAYIREKLGANAKLEATCHNPTDFEKALEEFLRCQDVILILELPGGAKHAVTMSSAHFFPPHWTVIGFKDVKTFTGEVDYMDPATGKTYIGDVILLLDKNKIRADWNWDDNKEDEEWADLKSIITVCPKGPAWEHEFGHSIGIDNDGSDGWSIQWDTTQLIDALYLVKATMTDATGYKCTDIKLVHVNNARVTGINSTKTVVAEGFSIDIDVSLENQGFLNGTFNVIALHSNTSIPSSNQTEIFRSIGDVNRDGFIDAFDLHIIQAAYDSIPGDPNWNPDCDLSPDLHINIFDMAICSGNFGKDIWVYFGLSPTPIGKQTITLTSGNSTSIVFTWNTTGIAKNNYTVRIVFWTLLNGTFLMSEVYVGGWVIVTIPGDVDGDFDVDLFDAVKLLLCFGFKVGDPCYDEDPNCDIDGDGDIDLFDAVRLLIHYGDEYP